MLSSPNQGTLAPVPAGCCVRGNAAFPAREGAEAQPGPRQSELRAPFLPEVCCSGGEQLVPTQPVLLWAGGSSQGHVLCSAPPCTHGR